MTLLLFLGGSPLINLIHMYTHMYVHMYVHVYVHMYVHIRVHMYVHIRVHMYDNVVTFFLGGGDPTPKIFLLYTTEHRINIIHFKVT